MTRRWALWFVAIFAIGLLAQVPIRLVIGSLADNGFTARQAAGTIWYGRIGELAFRDRRLGTFEVAANPIPLLLGSIEMRFNRMDDPLGSLAGVLISGSSKGVKGMSGRFGGSAFLGAMPIDAIETSDLTLLFKNGRCVEANGRLKATLSVPIPGFSTTELAGPPRCEGERVRFYLTPASGQGGLEFYVTASGQYRAWLRVVGVPVDASAGLVAAGFKQSGEGLVLSADGTL